MDTDIKISFDMEELNRKLSQAATIMAVMERRAERLEARLEALNRDYARLETNDYFQPAKSRAGKRGTATSRRGRAT